MAEPTVLVRDEGAVCRLVLNRPEVLNSISRQMLDELDASLDALERREELCTVVLTGSGRAFCAGADLQAARSRLSGTDPAAESAAFVTAIGDLFRRIENFPTPTIAAVNGIAVAGGLELMLCCDLVVASRSARIGDGHARFGLLPGAGGAVRLPRKIGTTRAKFMMFSGEPLDAVTLRDWGLILELAAEGELDAKVNELVQLLAMRSPLGLRRMKAMVNQGGDKLILEALAIERAINEEHLLSEDRREGLAAFAEKRMPRFRGR